MTLLPAYIYPFVNLILLVLYLRWRKMNFVDIGFRWKDLSSRPAIAGSILGILWAAFVVTLLGPLVLSLTTLPPADFSAFAGIRENFFQYIFVLVLAWVLIIPYEELVFRGFIFTALRRMAGDPSTLIIDRRDGTRLYYPQPATRFWFAGLLQSVIFAAYHWQQGGSAVVVIFIGSIIVIALYKIFKANLWYLIFFHIAYDTVMLTLYRYGFL